MNQNPKRKPRKPLRRVMLISLIVCALLGGFWAFWSYHGPAPAHEIFRGITYGCERLPETSESGGLLHWVQADLNVPGVSLYINPMEPEAQLHNYEYKLRHVSTAVSEDHLAAAVNGTLFSSNSVFIRVPGDFAISAETVVADHVMDHVAPDCYLMWWGDDLIAHLETTKPPSAAAIAKAKWAIGAEAPLLFPGRMPGEQSVDRRTFIAADPAKKLVWIVCFDKASDRFAGPLLVKLGAVIAIAVDGGTSTTMVIGRGAKNVRPGTIIGNWRPVATQFGFRADPLP
jgi:hypothetical protein